MNPAVPPPIPQPKRDADVAWKTYFGAASILVPASVFWVFGDLVLLPRTRRLWEDAGLMDSRAQWLMDLSYLCVHHSAIS